MTWRAISARPLVKVKAEGGDGGGGGGEGDDEETIEGIDRGAGVTEDENGVLYGAEGVKLFKEAAAAAAEAGGLLRTSTRSTLNRPKNNNRNRQAAGCEGE